MEDRQPDEATSLLHSSPSPPPSPPPNPPLPSSTTTTTTTTTTTKNPWRIIITAIAVNLLLNISSHISLVPQTYLLQSIICRRYYSSSSSPQHPHPPFPGADRCAIAPIQSEVAYINAWKDFFETLPVILLVVPYGALADRIGRKPVLLLAIVGCFMNDVWIRLVYWFPEVFPSVRAVWLGGLWQAIGAGAATFSSVNYVLVADVCPVEMRTTAFAYIQSAALLSMLVFVPVGGALIDAVSPWLPMMLGSGVLVLSFVVVVLFVPETLPAGGKKVLSDGEGDDERVNLIAAAADGSHGGGFAGRMKLRLREKASELAVFGRFLARNARVIVIMLCFFAFYFGEQAGGPLLLLYASSRLGWSLSNASFLISLGAAISIANLTLLIPATSSFLLRRLHLHETAKDKTIAQISGVYLVLGSATLFLAKSWILLVVGQVLCHLGYAFATPARSLVTGMVEKQHLGTLYTLISVLTYAGVLAGGPVFASVFKWGMRLGDFWKGLQFLLAGSFFALVLVAVSVAASGAGVKGKRREDRREEEGGDVVEPPVAS